jgi:uncharacterized protein YqeY
MSSLLSIIKNDLKEAMRNKDKICLTAIRMLLSAIKQIEVDERIDVNDERIVCIIEKMIKQRKDSIQQFESAERYELANNEKIEIEALKKYMPTPLTSEAIEEMIHLALNETDAKGMKDMRKVLAILKPKLQGKADMGSVSTLVKKSLMSKAK